MLNYELSVSQTVERAWELTKKHGLIIALFIFVIGCITSAFSMAGFPWQAYMDAIANNDQVALQQMQAMSGFSPMSILSNIIYTLLMAGILNMILQLIRGTQDTPSLSAFKMSVKTYAFYFLAQIIVGIIVGIGTLMCVIPGIFLAIRLSFVGTHLIAHPESDLGEAFSYSWNITKGNFWNLLGLTFINILFIILGLMACCIGVYFTAALTMFVSGVAYYALSEGADMTQSYVKEENTGRTQTYNQSER